MSVTIEMPKLSDTMSVGTVVKWHKNVGDQVSNGDILAEIETDKATMELENFDDGILLKILVEEGEEAPIGSPLAFVGEAGEDVNLPEAKEETLQHEEASSKNLTQKILLKRLIVRTQKLFFPQKKQLVRATFLIHLNSRFGKETIHQKAVFAYLPLLEK